MSETSTPLAAAHWPGDFRPYQRTALDTVGARWAEGRRRTWIVLPPGSGKTLVGLEAARRLGRRTVVLVPNTAIQGQWTAHWEAFDRPDGCSAGHGRDLADDVNVLTYQSLAVFDPDAETDEEGRTTASPRDRLHANGRALVDALHGAGPLTVLLDECHHLLQVWGRLLAEILDELPDAHVIGLTGTPAASLTGTEKALVDRLFGAPVTGASIPALVRDGYLAPFAELAYVTRPTDTERGYLAEQGTRFAEICTELLTPGFADTDFLPWVDARFVDRSTDDGGRLPWSRLASGEPALTDAVLRLHHAGLCALPDGARLLEEHRHPPRAEDWTALIGDYARHCLTGSGRDRAARERLRSALPSVGYHLTRHGVRTGTSPVDRVLARSDAKSHATVEIVAAERDAVGSRLRALVLCDHERAGARAPVSLRGVLADDAGSAWLQLSVLAADPRTAGLDPVLVTGRTVAMAPLTAAAFLDFARAETPDTDLSAREADGLHVVEGAWSPRTWVGVVTRFFESGGSQVLVGTRALLGEGWDARGVNTVVDLTTATTPTAVVQSRGRALRLDPSWPEKTAHTWTVVCVSHEHPRGAADWSRFVRKHQGYLGAAADGAVMSGVAHVDPAFSPYEPPDDPGAVNTRMIARAARRDETRERWRIGEPYEDVLLPTLRVRDRRAPAVRGEDVALPPPPGALAAPAGAVRAGEAPAGAGAAAVTGMVLAVLCLLLAVALPWLLAAAALLGAASFAAVRHRRISEAASLLRRAAEPVDTTRYACAVADTLHATGRAAVGAKGVRAHVDTDGVYRFTLTGAGPEAAEAFATALDEVLGPLVGSPLHLVPRYVLPVPSDTGVERAHARAQLSGDPVPNTAVYHVVPSLFGRSRKGAEAFGRAWNTWVCAGSVVSTRSGPGREVLAAHFGGAPTGVSTGRRMAWE
ncbi:DEAD/DEAH box helicase family protein [Nocardiopsis sp. CT-R113]|uniref:DEAD/DEAH box helicase family protein n=1 Tax=Nocardiopsis codii TaxID=3065942 RepID=A0ABU7KCA7_9ACTN|nr:DEAD/DEAH box helicase family protein [Nocardiopsis sp. CT-R113]MEE2039870.1 DEAD/DEAH box helicase family protein [Nocardiopsis sp. CT-R113]